MPDREQVHYNENGYYHAVAGKSWSGSVLEKYYQSKIVPENTLIIFDEIQMCERALTSLKYFSEEAPEYHVMAARSLLDVTVNREKIHFQWGKFRC